MSIESPQPSDDTSPSTPESFFPTDEHDLRRVIKVSHQHSQQLINQYRQGPYWKQARRNAFEATIEFAKQTDEFTNITVPVIRSNPEWVEILRYLPRTKLSQSQMGTRIGKHNTSAYENGTRPSREQAEKLIAVAEDLISPHKVGDPDAPAPERRVHRNRVAGIIAEKIAEQRCRTKARIGPSQQQEENIRAVLSALGFTEVSRSKPISEPADLDPGTFVDETMIAASDGSNYRADIVARLPNGRMVLVEAKMISAKKDSANRYGKTRNKREVWENVFPDPIIGAVLMGEFSVEQVQNMIRDGMEVYWSHRLDEFADAIAARTPGVTAQDEYPVSWGVDGDMELSLEDVDVDGGEDGRQAGFSDFK